MKKIILSLICGILVVGLVTGCGKDTNKSNDSSTNSKSINEYSWQDFVIEIDGNIIKMGDKASSLAKIDFTTTDSEYNSNLEKGHRTQGTTFRYKDASRGYNDNTVEFAIYNSSDSTKLVSECDLNGLSLTSKFFENYNVTLPGGILLTKTLNINDIINVWGQYTEQSPGRYDWIYNYNEIRVYINDDDTIFSVVYEL